VVGNLTLLVSMFFNCLDYLLVSFALITQNPLRKNIFKRRSVHIPLAFRYVGYVLVLSEMIYESIYKFVFSEYSLSPLSSGWRTYRFEQLGSGACLSSKMI